MAAHVTTSRRLRRALAAVALLGLAGAGLGGCSASDSARSWSRDGDSSASEQQAPGVPQSAPDTGSGGGSKDSSTTGGSSSGTAPVSLLTGNRDLIRTGQLSVEVGDLAGAAARARAFVATQGGQISSENSVLTADGSGGSYPGPMPGSFVQLVIALPPEALDASMDSLAELGELSSRSQSVEDVTLQVVDLESRTASMRASIERVRALMDRATTIADVVALETELSRREADLESMTGQLQSLQSQAAVSTLVLTLTADSEPVAADDGDRDGALGALTDSLDALGSGVRAVLIGIAAALPFVALIAVVGGAGWLIARPRRRAAQLASGTGGTGGTGGTAGTGGAPEAPAPTDD